MAGDRYEPEKRTALLYSSISGQINPGNVFVAGLRSCNKAESPKTVSKDAIAILPKCVQRHTYLVLLNNNNIPKCVQRHTYLVLPPTCLALTSHVVKIVGQTGFFFGLSFVPRLLPRPVEMALHMWLDARMQRRLLRLHKNTGWTSRAEQSR